MSDAEIKIRLFISEAFRKIIKESASLDKLLTLAKGESYDYFVKKTDSLTNFYDILYRGTSENELTNQIFMTDYIGHAKQYGDNVLGIVVDSRDQIVFDDNTFENLKKWARSISKNDLISIYEPFFKKDKLFDAMVGKYSNKRGVLTFVSNFIKSDIPYSTVQQNKVKNDLLIPIMLHYAKLKGKNIISFVGGDYFDYGGADEFVVNDVSKYVTLKSIWEKANQR